jgi:hypothetical protein
MPRRWSTPSCRTRLTGRADADNRRKNDRFCDENGGVRRRAELSRTRHECAAVRGTDGSRGGESGVNNSPTDSALTGVGAGAVPHESEPDHCRQPSGRVLGPVRAVRRVHGHSPPLASARPFTARFLRCVLATAVDATELTEELIDEALERVRRTIGGADVGPSPTRRPSEPQLDVQASYPQKFHYVKHQGRSGSVPNQRHAAQHSAADEQHHDRQEGTK